MFTLDDMRNLLNSRPFVPVRLWMSDGGRVDVRSQEVVLPFRRFSIVGLLDPEATDTALDRYVTVWYMHVTRHKMLNPGAPPFSPPGQADANSPAPD